MFLFNIHLQNVIKVVSLWFLSSEQFKFRFIDSLKDEIYFWCFLRLPADETNFPSTCLSLRFCLFLQCTSVPTKRSSSVCTAVCPPSWTWTRLLPSRHCEKPSLTARWPQLNRGTSSYWTTSRQETNTHLMWLNLQFEWSSNMKNCLMF